MCPSPPERDTQIDGRSGRRMVSLHQVGNGAELADLFT
jgi:hypothetical protein